MKPIVKICTPFLNEWDIDFVGANSGIPKRNKQLLPVEKSIDALCERAGARPYIAGDVVELPEFVFRWVRVRGTYIARSRNALVSGRICPKVNQKPEESYTHFLMLDSDIEFTFSDIISLLLRDEPIVGGAYRERTHRDCWTAGDVESDGLSFIKASPGACDMVPVGWIGAGFLLIKREVFESMPYKWFDCLSWTFTDADGDACVESWEEDTSFCIKAKEYGYTVFLDQGVVLKHHFNQGAKQMEQKQPEFSISDRQVIAMNKVQEIGNIISGLYSDVRILLDELNKIKKDSAKVDENNDIK